MKPEEITEIITKDYKPGCYGLKYPFSALATNVVIYRRNGDGQIELLTGIRGPGRWEEGKFMIAFGGYVDPSDPDVRTGTLREIEEEVGTVHLDLPDESFFSLGPHKFKYLWDAKAKKAVKTDVLVQRIPVVTFFYLAEYVSGEIKACGEKNEVQELNWQAIPKIAESRIEHAFDFAKVFEAVYRHFI